MLYLTKDLFPVFVPLGVIGFYRYLWFTIKLLAYFFYRPMMPKADPTYRAEHDVTIIVPTIDAGEEFKEAAHSWLVNNPKEIIIITETKMRDALQELANSVDPTRIRVLTVPKANKRLQMVEGIRNTTSEIIVFADDDAIWAPTCLEYILACFEDPNMGGVGTSQTVKSVGRYQTVWEVLAGFRLTIRNIEIAASTHIDGGVCCLSGRTAAYRTCILQDPQFQYEFTHDFWLGKYPLNSGDDKFLTRWMVYHGWNTYVQICKEAELLSTFKNNWRFIKQVLRWTRNTWRSDFRSLFTERKIWSRHPYVAFTMVDKIFNPITLLSGPISVIVMACEGKFHLPIWDIVISYIVWLMLTRIVKLLPHLIKRPQDIIWVPAFLVFGYYFAIMKIYALFTLHEVGWGTRAGIDQTPAEILQEKEKQLQQEQMRQETEKQSYQSDQDATHAAINAAAAAATTTQYEQQIQRLRIRPLGTDMARPDPSGSAELIRHFTRQQEQQRQSTAARTAAAAGRPLAGSFSRQRDVDEDDDPEVYEYNQDDELAQYFAQADAALANTAQRGSYGGYSGGSSTSGRRAKSLFAQIKLATSKLLQPHVKSPLSSINKSSCTRIGLGMALLPYNNGARIKTAIPQHVVTGVSSCHQQHSTIKHLSSIAATGLIGAVKSLQPWRQTNKFPQALSLYIHNTTRNLSVKPTMPILQRPGKQSNLGTSTTTAEFLSDMEVGDESDPAATLRKSLAAIPHYPVKNEIRLRITELDSKGNIRISAGEFLKSDLCQKHGLHPRDLRKIDGGFSNQMPVVLVRPEVILVNLGHIRALIKSGLVTLFDSPDSKDRVEDSPFVKDLQEKLKMSSSNGEGPPFEFRALEAIFLSVVASLHAEMEVLVHFVTKLLAHLEEDIDQHKLKEMLQYTKKVSRFESKSLLIRNVFEELLDQDEDLAAMYLTEKKQGHPRATDSHDEAEILLEAYMKQVEEIVNVVSIMKQQMQSTEDYVNVVLDAKRNQLLLFELRIAMGTLGMSSGAVIAGLYGMNLHNYLESEPHAFAIVSATALGIGAMVFIACARKLKVIARGTTK
ncbi:hypothetical protein BGX28_005511 [Mortierella sp. GBA30]|nr:hypothetical protein BGX28_005511 [Mortierella sp. GBA30]